jgi:hypothetical protein
VLAMQIAGADDPDEADENYRARKRQSDRKRRKTREVSRATKDGVAQESPSISLAVRRIEGMIRRLALYRVTTATGARLRSSNTPVTARPTIRTAQAKRQSASNRLRAFRIMWGMTHV